MRKIEVELNKLLVQLFNDILQIEYNLVVLK